MSVPVIFNPLATDSTKIIRPISDFIVLRRDGTGQPVLLLSADLKQVFKLSNGVAIPISDKTALDIVTFDGGVGAKVFVDNEDTPDFEDILKARKFGSATIEQTAGGKGKITTTAGADTAYFVGKKDSKKHREIQNAIMEAKKKA